MKKVITLLFIYAVLLSSSCSKQEASSGKMFLEQINSYHIDVPEPSGLAINSSGNILYTVSDNTNKVYKMNTTGLILQTFAFVGNDLEGVCSYTDGKLLLAEERTKKIIELTMTSGVTTEYQMNYDNSNTNSGIEGITYNSNENIVYFINEKNPSTLFKLNTSFNAIQSYDLNFANDYSGLFYEASTNVLWIISDESQTVNKCTTEGELLEVYSINVNKPEGIVVANDKIYIVSDSQEKLYVFQKPNEN